MTGELPPCIEQTEMAHIADEETMCPRMILEVVQAGLAEIGQIPHTADASSEGDIEGQQLAQ